jgi:hypothetical protein
MIKQQVLVRYHAASWFAFCVAAACICPARATADDPPVTDASAEEARIPFAGTGNFSVTIGGAKVQSLWKREVMRQALLLAARGEMGYLPADNTLGEGVSRTKPSLELACTAGKPDRIQLLQGLSGKREVVWTQDFKFNSLWPSQRNWVERMELMSRTTFVEALEKAKYVKRPTPRAKDLAAPLDPALAQLIDEDLSFVGQFLALRQLHAAVVSDGETAARLAGLVKAYAHLGLLTEHQWHPMSYAFKARALLYAQRWLVREPKSPLARQHRAYAFALVGMHGDALADLRAAARLAGDTSVKPEPPAWIPLIEHFCRYDFEDLNRLRADERLKPLASLLYFLAHEQEGSRNLTVKVGLSLLKEMPGCYRMHDTLCHHTGPGAAQLTTLVGPRHLAMTLLPRLEKVEDLPKHVRLTLDLARAEGAMLTEGADEDGIQAELEYRAKVIAALRGIVTSSAGTPAPAPDTIEPSWSVLAKIIEETTFLQTYRRAYFIRRQIGVPADDYLDAHRPIVANHRRIVFLDQFHTQTDPEKLEAATQKLDVTNLDFTQARFWVEWPVPLRQQVEAIARANQEGLANEAGLTARSYPFEMSLGPGPLIAVSPHSPYAMGAALRSDPPPPETKKAWEEVAQRSPYLAWSFAEVALRRGDQTNVERFLKLAAQLDPSFENYQRLASFYKGRRDDENWLKAWNDFLKTPSLGLEHAQVQCEIVQYYASRREWDKALPYADAAGETGAQWAMNWARTINEANQNWEAAEKHYVAAIGRYGERPLEWYLFCKRNGVGELDLAREAAFPDGVEEFAATSNMPVYAGLALWLEGKPSKALELYEKQATSAPDSFMAMQAATMADSLGQNAKRDKLLKLVVEQKPPAQHPHEYRPQREELVGLARQFIGDLAAGAKCKFDMNQLHAMRDKAPERDHCGFNYFLACYLDRHGKPDLAVDYWKQCMGAPELDLGTRTLAGAELSKRGIQASQWKQLLFARPAAAK